MDKFIIRGGEKLTGEVAISGSKNSALSLISAALLANGHTVIENLPHILDLIYFIKILDKMGVKSCYNKGKKTLEINSNEAKPFLADSKEIKQISASYYLLGALLGRFGYGKIPIPGSDDIGTRAIDQHEKGFRALGAKVKVDHGFIEVESEKLIGNNVYFDVVSVGATINTMLAAVLAEGVSILENAAREPHIVDLANFLNTMGAKITGAGTDVIKIKGVTDLQPCNYCIIPDQIEAGTYMVIAAGTQGDILIKNIIHKHLEPITAKITEAGAMITEGDDWIRVIGPKRINPLSIRTMPYPGFPTDMQPPLTALLTKGTGVSYITETIWDGRFKHVDELRRMGAVIRVEGKSAVIEGTEKIYGAPVTASDLRSGAALVIAGLMAEGQTEINGIEHIDSGYENIIEKLTSLGAEICRV